MEGLSVAEPLHLAQSADDTFHLSLESQFETLVKLVYHESR